MNYYDHHIRDYDAATSHLSWDEDMAYSRLLRWYYRKERPIPADLKEACRQVRATTKVQQDAVKAVLEEFFELREDGWHQDKCDEAIATYHAREPEREAKKKNEDTRLARHRAERTHLFGIINAAGIHRPWNAPIAELRDLAAQLQDPEPETESTKPATQNHEAATQPATATATPATDSQRLPMGTCTPVPTPHSPLPTPHSPKIEEGESSGRSDEEPVPRPSMATAICLALKAVGVGSVSPGHPRLLALVASGAEVQHFVDVARAAKKKDFAYILGTVEGQLADARATAATATAATRPATPMNGGHSGSTARAARMAEASPNLVGTARDDDFIDTEATDVTPRRLG